MRWPGPDNRRSPLPSPDDRFARFPGPDHRATAFPTPPIPTRFRTAAAVGSGVASGLVVILPWRDGAAVGGGVATAAIETSVAINAAASGVGTVTAVIERPDLDAPAFGSGSASATIIPVVLMPAMFAGSGSSTSTSHPAAVINAAASGTGTASATLAPRIVIPSAAAGSGAATAALAPRPSITAPASGSGSASAAVTIAYTYTDNFNRANGVLGGNWVYGVSNISPQISGNQAAYTSTTAINGTARWVSATATDDQRVAFTTRSALTSQYDFLILRCNSGFTSWVGAIITTGGLQISTYTSGAAGGQTARATAAGDPGIASGSVVTFTAIGNTYTLYDDGVQKLQWVDSGGVATVGASNRYGGFGISRAGLTNGAPVDDFLFQDV